jgi:hypothetical protein
VINEGSNDLLVKIPELLARYCDALLKKSPKSTLTEADIDAKLTSAVRAFDNFAGLSLNINNPKAVLFKYVDDKDVFQKFYTRFLARRLVNFATVSEESESNMITKLRETCGAEYTNKLQRMLTDIRLSDEMNTKYKKSRDVKGASKDFGSVILGPYSSSFLVQPTLMFLFSPQVLGLFLLTIQSKLSLQRLKHT